MKRHLSAKSIITATIVGALVTPMLAFALPCTRTASSPSALHDLNAAFARFNR